MQTVIYGIHAVKSRLKSAPDSVDQVLIQKGKQDSHRIKELLDMINHFSISCSFVTKEKLDDQSQNGVHQGIALLCRASNNILDETDVVMLIKNQPMPLVLILDGITDPHNLGACLRTALAVRASCVILPKDKSAPINATVAKVSSGASEIMPISYVTNLARLIDQLKALGIWIMGLEGEATQTLYQTDCRMPLAIVMGSEGKGLRQLTRKKCDYLIKLPMNCEIESLNVSVAAGVTLYEILRQRTTS